MANNGWWWLTMVRFWDWISYLDCVREPRRAPKILHDLATSSQLSPTNSGSGCIVPKLPGILNTALADDHRAPPSSKYGDPVTLHHSSLRNPQRFFGHPQASQKILGNHARSSSLQESRNWLSLVICKKVLTCYTEVKLERESVKTDSKPEDTRNCRLYSFKRFHNDA